MTPLGRMRDHVNRIRGMAKATDVRLDQAYADGLLSQTDWADLVRICRGCGWAGSCDTWIRRHRHEPCAPPGCLNRDSLRQLRRQQEEA